MADPFSYTPTIRETRRRLPDDAGRLSRNEVEGSVSDHFERIAGSIPDHIAVKTTRHQFTYGALNCASNRLARTLLSKQPPGEHAVALLLDRGAWLSVGVLGVLKARGFYVVLNPLHPRPRITYILTDSQAHLIVTDNRHLGLARELARDLLAVVNIDEIAPDLPSDNLGLPASSSSVASITYTSGSTGTPKGVIHSHGFLLRRRLAGTRLGIGVEDRVATVGSSSSQFRPLLNGAGAYPWNVKEDGLSNLAGWLKEERITVFHAVPSVFRDFAASLTTADDFPDLRLITLRGETLYRRDVELHREHFGSHSLLVNEFGASETGTIGQHIIDNDTAVTGNIVPVGYVLEDKSVRLLDDEGNPVVCGQVGEIAVTSRYLSPGYWRNSILTNARFRPDPDGEGRRTYLTGDLGRMLADGCLVHVGRKDSQVKIRAQRIELAEIEAALRHLDNIREAAVVAREDRPGDKRLVAYLVAAVAPAPSVTTLVRGLSQSIPDYMIPAAFVVMEALPMTPNGKVDRLALPAPGRARPHLAVGYCAARTAVEETLVRIWTDVLDLDQVGIHDNFFDLGGHSLLATRVVAQVGREFSVELPLSTLFEISTIERLALYLVEQQTKATSPRAMNDLSRRLTGLSPTRRSLLERRLRNSTAAPQTIPRRADAGSAPLSFAQQRLWFLDQLEPGSALYNVPAVASIHGPLDSAALERSLEEIVRRQEALRTTFRCCDGQPIQVIDAEFEFHLALADLRELQEPERETEARRLAQEETSRPFDLSRDLMLRARLIRLSDDEHVFVLTLHHIASDGWSSGVLWRELAALYEAFADGRPSPLAELPVQYADYAVWQRESLQGEFLNRQLAYWRERLERAPAVLELPTDFPRPTVQSYKGARQEVRLDRSLTEALQQLSRREGTTLFMTLLAAWQVLLSRYSGQEDVVVGSAIAGRQRTELEGLIGFFVNTLALRTDLSGNPTFRELLGRVREVTLGAYAHQDLPFEKLVEELQPERSLSHSPLFQVMLVFQNAPRTARELKGSTVSPVESPHATAKFDLTLSLHETAEGLRGSLEYNTDLFAPATITRMLGHFQVLLQGIVADPERPIGELPLLTEDERQQLLVEWNQTVADYPRDKCVHQLFEEQAERTPDAVAVVCGDGQLTYRELNIRANRLAHCLTGLGVRPQQPVAVLLDRSVEFVVSVLAVLKTGAAYVPLETGAPPARLRMLVEDTGAAILLTCAGQQAPDDLPDVRQVLVDDAALHLERQPDGNPPRRSTADAIAYVIYTSGSTGLPKGVLVPHRGVVRLVCGTDYVPFGKGLRFLLLASPAFDASTFELWGALLHGSTCVVYPERVPDLDDLERLLHEQHINCLWLTSSLFNAVVDHRSEALAGLSHLMIGGEALSIDHVRRFRARQPGVALVNGYGPTESTTFTCTYPIPHELPVQWTSIPIGQPIANTEVYVLDAARQPVPIGVPGELYIGGDGLARGYLDRPELTGEKFVPDPFRSPANARLYRTGDLVRWKEDGNLEFLGRQDQQVKLRGFRIELGEIEAALTGSPAVAQAVVLLREDRPGEKRLVAYVVPADRDARPPASALHSDLLQRLPDYMIPSAYVTLDTLPLTPNGKLDRQALPAPGFTPSHRAGDDHLPRTLVEELLTAVWRDILGLDQVGIHDDFFALGGHSLLATRVVARVRDALAVDLPVRALFEAPTVAGLAERIAHAERGRLAAPARPIRSAPRDQKVPLSFAQERLWFLDQLEPGSAAYNVPSVMRLRGPLIRRALEESLAAIVRRHEILRTAITAHEGMPQPVVARETEFRLAFDDLRNLPEGVRESEARRLAAAEMKHPFDLTGDLMLRARLIRLADTEHVFVLTTHHIASDGWSLGVLWRELAALYEDFSDGRPSSLPELPVQYADYALWQRKWLQGEVLNRQLAYWKERLASAPPVLELPTDFPRPAVRSHRGARQELVLGKELTQSLLRLSRQEGVTPFMTLLAAWQVLLARCSGQEDVVVGAPIAGRQRTQFEDLIGFFVNTLAMRTDLSGNPTFRELLGRVREVTLGAYAHQDLPFEKLVEVLQPERSLSHSPLFQVMLVLQNAPRNARALRGLSAEAVEVANTTSKFDLTLSLQETSDGLRGSLGYCTDLFEPATITRMLGHFQVLLQGIVADPGRRIGGLPLLTEVERQQILVDWNQTTTEAAHDGNLHQLFEEQVERTPDALAVVFQEQRLTFRELNERANRLAHHLCSLGVGPERLVGLCMQRSLEMIVAVVGILKAGGAYVPLDPEYPAARLDKILADAAPSVVLSAGPAARRLPSTAQVLLLDSPQTQAALDRAPAHDPTDRERLVTLAPHHPAYVIYTSGSTGTPKGVVIEQRSVLNLMHGLDRAIYERQNHPLRVSVNGSLAFDTSVKQIIQVLRGHALHLIPESLRLDGPALIEYVRRHRIDVLDCTPSQCELLLEAGLADATASAPSVVLVGGEPIDARLWETLRASRGPRFYNLYGPTECTVDATTCAVTQETVRPSIGRPIANVRTYVLGPNLHLLAAGVPGELYIGGAGLARGYLNQPALTAEKFIPDPFSERPGARLYRTGDRVRWRGDGTLEFVGRSDRQIKLRGFRIELGEVEVALSGFPQVSQCVVLLREDRPGDQRLVAYIVPRPATARPVAADLRGYLQERLPEHMIPSTFVMLDTFPLTPNGKVDRKELPVPGNTTVLPAASTGVSDSIEAQLTLIWEDLLSTRPIHPEDDFFDLGGHSLLAVRLLSRVAQVFNQRVPLRVLFLTPTVRGMAQLLRDRRGEHAWPTLIPIQPHGTRPPLFCVAAPNVNALGFVFLARHLGTDQPVYGLQRQDVANPERFYTQAEYEALAAASISALCEVWPEGPCLLCGFCEGTHIAFEMARQLTAAGREVGLLAMFDAWPLENTASRFRHRLIGTCRRWMNRLRSGRFSTVVHDLRRQVGWLTGYVTRSTVPEETNGMASDPFAVASWNRWRQRMWPGKDFVPPVFGGRITVFRVRRQPLWRVRDYHLGWKARAAEGVDVHEIPGVHQTILREPHVQVLAARLTECIARINP